MTLLAIETSTEACSAALCVGDAVYERFELAPQRHGERVLIMIEELLAEAALRLSALDGLAFGRGPGAFTGVRIGAALIQGIALGTGLAVAPVSTLAALAQGAYRRYGERQVLAAIDARMGEVYFGAYRADSAGLMRLDGGEQVAPPEAVAIPQDGPWWATGGGWAAHGGALMRHSSPNVKGLDPDPYPHARDLLPLALHTFACGGAVPAAAALPVYLRESVVGAVSGTRG